jgi:hypothetical protein
VYVSSRDSGVPSKGQPGAIPSVGFRLSNAFFVVADSGGFQPVSDSQDHRLPIFKMDDSNRALAISVPPRLLPFAVKKKTEPISP